MITSKQLADLEEGYGDNDPGWGMIIDTPEHDQMDAEECNGNMKFVFDCEELAQDESDPCLGRRCDECEIGGCEYGIQVVS